MILRLMTYSYISKYILVAKTVSVVDSQRKTPVFTYSCNRSTTASLFKALCYLLYALLTKNSFLEGTRLSSTVGLYRDVVKSGEVDDNGTAINVKVGQRLFCNLTTASMDPTVFPEPAKVNLNRALDSYIHYGVGPHECLGKGLSLTGLTAMLKTVGRLKNLRRAPGPQGEVKKIAGPYGVTLYMTEDQRSYFPFPTTMKINWDGELPPLRT
jgi:linoleate 8R-lipoxygenase/9,12-octadecadienoate 8-hydroperoxide 8R-isomerase